MIEVFKFGGASVKDAAGIKNLAQIITRNRDKNLLVVVSAMGKTTNALEKLTKAYVRGDAGVHAMLDDIRTYHEQIIDELFGEKQQDVYNDVSNSFVEIDWIIEDEPHDDFDFIYDQIVSVGELVSTKIVSAYLKFTGLDNIWLDARNYIHTDNTYREGQVEWNKTTTAIGKLTGLLKNKPLITQGFIGGTSENYTTTLGREGSDYTAAIFAAGLEAEAVTIWKDVPGVLNADPKLFSNVSKYDVLPYSEALEMTYYGATVIHPKTIKPLQNAKIPLLVKPFLQPEEAGTVVKEGSYPEFFPPAIIVKDCQVLISLKTKDVSFITENHLSDIFGVFALHHVKVNMMQISAISFSACIDSDEQKFEKLKKAFETDFTLKYNAGLKLITVRHFNKETLDELAEGKTILLEQLSRNTAQLVLKSE